MSIPVQNRVRVAGAFVAVVATWACSDDATSATALANQHVHEQSVDAAKSPIGGAGNALLKQVHAATARFHSTVQAEKAGYSADPFCVEHPTLGGMGHHWANTALVDPIFDPLKPEVMLYAPDRNGNLKLVAIEYIVINSGQAAPTFAGHPFDVGGTPVPVAHWSLHVWLVKPNPAGLFTPFNPDVSCPAAP